jgi:hypothetical protein
MRTSSTDACSQISTTSWIASEIGGHGDSGDGKLGGRVAAPGHRQER